MRTWPVEQESDSSSWMLSCTFDRLFVPEMASLSLSWIFALCCELPLWVRLGLFADFDSKGFPRLPGKVKNLCYRLFARNLSFLKEGLALLVAFLFKLTVSLRYFSTRSSAGLFFLNSIRSFSASSTSFCTVCAHRSQFSLGLQAAYIWEVVIVGSLVDDRNFSQSFYLTVELIWPVASE